MCCFTAMDAHVREYQLIMPADCVGAGSRDEVRHALFTAERALTDCQLSAAEVLKLDGCFVADLAAANAR